MPYFKVMCAKVKAEIEDKAAKQLHTKSRPKTVDCYHISRFDDFACEDGF